MGVGLLPEISSSGQTAAIRIPFRAPVLSTVNVVSEGRPRPFLESTPILSSCAVPWRGIALNTYTVPAVLIPRHEHPEHFLHVVVQGSVRYEVNTRGRNLRFTSRPGTISILPIGTVDEVNWKGETRRIAMAIHPRLLTDVVVEATNGKEIELMERWDLIDRHISALAMEITSDLEDGTPAGTLYGESLVNALAVYLLKRYAVRPLKAVANKGRLPPYRLKRMLDFIEDNLHQNISLSRLASIAGMSPHYFSERFKQSTGHTPHNYVLLRRIERAKQQLCDLKHSVIDAGLGAGFENPSHFARVFRKVVGVSPSHFRAGM